MRICHILTTVSIYYEWLSFNWSALESWMDKVKSKFVLDLPPMYIKNKSHKRSRTFFSDSLRKNKNTGRKLNTDTRKVSRQTWSDPSPICIISQLSFHICISHFFSVCIWNSKFLLIFLLNQWVILNGSKRTATSGQHFPRFKQLPFNLF